jgi:hypothetical protein
MKTMAVAKTKKLAVYLNGKSYNKTKALDLLKGILNAYPLGSELSAEDCQTVLDALEYHPSKDEKIGVGIRAVEVVREEMYGGRRFELVRIDGSRQDFSYIKCLQTSNLHFKDVMKAMRYVVIPQVRAFKERAFGNKTYIRCAITNLNIRMQDAHTDHKPPLSFNVLAFNFLKMKGLKIEEVSVKETAHIACVDLADETLKAEWYQYHLHNAELQVVLDHANFGQSRSKVSWDELN